MRDVRPNRHSSESVCSSAHIVHKPSIAQLMPCRQSGFALYDFDRGPSAKGSFGFGHSTNSGPSSRRAIGAFAKIPNAEFRPDLSALPIGLQINILPSGSVLGLHNIINAGLGRLATRKETRRRDHILG